MKPTLNILYILIFGLHIVFLFASSFSFKMGSLSHRVRLVDNNFLRIVTPTSLYVFLELCQDNSKKLTLKNFTPKSLDEIYQELNTKDLDTYLSHKVRGVGKKEISHVFYIVSESLSEYYFNKEFDSIGLMSGLKSLLKQENAYKMELFLQNASMTIKTLSTLMSGLIPFENVSLPRSSFLQGKKTFVTSIAPKMQELGFSTNLYYAGSSNWHNLGDFAKNQGFNHFYSYASMIDYAKKNYYPKPIENNYGLHDNILFDYILDNTYSSLKSFNLILSLSHHPTRNVNLKAFDVPTEKIERFFQNNKEQAQFFAHAYWYDKILSQFIQKARQKYPNALFIITGDHFDRNFSYPSKYPLKEHSSVPLIILSPFKLYNLKKVASHIDISPTIYELSAPYNFEYKSFGTPFYARSFFKQPFDFALGDEVVANTCMVASDNLIEEFKKSCNKTNASRALEKLNLIRALSFILFEKTP
ncbi:LTA synthase family protein [Helicobacter cetorum]|uniref:Sulfatase N-terminal domain-containing protein n=1 Tax=Helicobacter cetorum (strain ATCC BAA-429 / MIT 00-7128) TaxID=182217 RepID=I0EMY3_HELC0|nr:LTA synthase family protein [Helicobacter cetorum]AFI04302.1 hypothetical protein HCW_05185 [Helicobacter cetorum MIT 00-7128]